MIPLESALSASAWILDSVVENDAKFARAIEREYENLSADLRRWFKKLAVCGLNTIPLIPFLNPIFRRMNENTTIM